MITIFLGVFLTLFSGGNAERKPRGERGLYDTRFNAMPIPWGPNAHWPRCDQGDGSRGLSLDHDRFWDDDRIVGGEESSPDKWPFLIKFDMNCGGSIINDNWVLTAAHCCDGVSSKSEMSKMTANICRFHLDECEEAFAPVSIHMHPDYISASTGWDFCLVEYPEGSFKEKTQICRSYEPMVVDQFCFIAGWGTLMDSGTTMTPTLHEASVPVLPNEACNKEHRYNGLVQDNMACAGSFEGGIDACQGDSGGPMVCMSGNTPVLKGVTSWGMGCAKKNHPGIYARVEYAADWIERVLDGEDFRCNHDLQFDENGQAVLSITDYKKNALCNYFAYPEGSSVEVEILDMDIENHPVCKHDFLAIGRVRDQSDRDALNYRGQGNQGMMMRKLCGSCKTSFVVDGNNPLVFAFRTDTKDEFTGITLRLTKVADEPTSDLSPVFSNINCESPACDSAAKDCSGQCSNAVFTEPTGSVLSHEGFPNVKYDPFLSCEWIIDLREHPAGSLINAANPLGLVFDDIEIEDDSDCLLDYVSIYDINGKLIEKFCWYAFKRYKIFLDSNYARIVWVSDKSIQRGGFSLWWKMLPPKPVGPKPVKPPQDCLSTPEGVLLTTANGREQCGNNKKGAKCYFVCAPGYHIVPYDTSSPALPLKKSPKVVCKNREWLFPKGNWACRDNNQCHMYPAFQKTTKPWFKLEKVENEEKRLTGPTEEAGNERKVITASIKIKGDILQSTRSLNKGPDRTSLQDFTFFFICGSGADRTERADRCDWSTMTTQSTAVLDIISDPDHAAGQVMVVGKTVAYTVTVKFVFTADKAQFDRLFTLTGRMTWENMDQFLKKKIKQNFHVGVIGQIAENFDCA